MRLFLKNLLFTVVVPGSVGAFLPWLIVQGRSPAGGWAVYVSLPVFALGVAIYGWCLWDFASFGRGTPAPVDAPKRLVVRGLYRYSRNPMYVGVLMGILGWVLRYQAADIAGYFLLIAMMFQTFVVFYEEPHLKRVFGEEYDAYRACVRRWF